MKSNNGIERAVGRGIGVMCAAFVGWCLWVFVERYPMDDAKAERVARDYLAQRLPPDADWSLARGGVKNGGDEAEFTFRVQRAGEPRGWADVTVKKWGPFYRAEKRQL